MTPAHRLLGVLAAAVLALALAAPASAAAPSSFFGVMADGPALGPRVDLDAETKLMTASGVGTLRVAFYWRSMQPFQRFPINFDETDRIVGAAARAGLRVFPTVVRSPAWASGGDDRESAVPDTGEYATFIAAVVHRYGQGGTFWQQEGMPQLPVTSWQVWNEPDIGRYWSARPWPSTYVTLLRAARDAIKGVDPAAQVVAAGLTNKSWRDLEKLYKAGGGPLFDAAAIHPFSQRPGNVLKIVRYARRVMKANGDAAKPLVLSEISWSSGKGRSTFNYGWEETERGQAARIRQVLPMLARYRVRLGIQALYWYTWLSPPVGDDESFSYSGLRKMRRGKPISKPALRAFSSTVRRLR